MKYTTVTRVHTRDEASEAVNNAIGVIAIVDRQGPRTVVFKCPCGCGDTISIAVDPLLEESWQLRQRGETISLLPSVWRTTGCESHFVLWDNTVWWCSGREGDTELDWPLDLRDALE